MAEFGANYPCFCADSKEAGVVLGKLVSANLTVNLASGEIYADDGLAEQLSEFASGTIAMETDDMTDDNAAEVYGCTVSEKVVTYNKGDSAPRGVLLSPRPRRPWQRQRADARFQHHLQFRRHHVHRFH